MAQKKLDLSKIAFNENAEVLLKGVATEKTAKENGVVSYALKNPGECTFGGAVPEYQVTIRAKNNIVSSVYAMTQKTANTDALLKALIAKYKQPTVKVKDEGDVRAYYWQTPTLFIRFMSGESVPKSGGMQVFSFVHIAPVKALKEGVDPDLNDIYQYMLNRKPKS